MPRFFPSTFCSPCFRYCFPYCPPVSFAGSRTELRRNLLTYLTAIVPVSASDLINTTVEEISKNSSGGKVWFGLVTSLYFASSGIGALIEGLNVAYDVKETRAWWRRTLLAILLTIALAALIITALALMQQFPHGGERPA